MPAPPPSPVQCSISCETDDVAGGIDVDSSRCGFGWERRHGLDVTGEGIDVASSSGQANASDRKPKAKRSTEQRGVVRERILSFGDADGELIESLQVKTLELPSGVRRKLDSVGAVHLRRNRRDLVGHG